MSIRVALATTSALAAQAGAAVAKRGGNAVDVAIAAALLSANTEPGVCALAGGGYVTLGRDARSAVTFDGNVAVPGLDNATSAVDGETIKVKMAYGGGTETLIGAGSVAVPGTLAALDAAWQEAGSVPWAALVEPSVQAVREGFPLSSACHYYLRYSATPIFSVSLGGREALLNAAGELKPAGARIHVPGLADTLERIAANGAREFYRGELAHQISEWVGQRGGVLTTTDLASYAAIRRQPIERQISEWQLFTNPAPAIGGAMLTHVLDRLLAENSRDRATTLIESLLKALEFRRENLDHANDLEKALQPILANHRTSGATVHTSAVDDSGLACAITLSAGYGSGEMPPGTGLWLNNCLGEIDLNKPGLAAAPVGRRLISNMAPTIAFSSNRALAIGSPGASRITSALCQTVEPFLLGVATLQEAIEAARVHVELDEVGQPSIHYESGFTLPDQYTGHCYETMNMYFGGVGAALITDGQLSAFADPRRVGGTFISGS